MNPTPFAVIGTGWRAEFFLRIAQARPDLFRVTHVLSRTPERAERLSNPVGAKPATTLDELESDRPRFVVVSVQWDASPGWIRTLADRGYGVLAETPPAPDLDALKALSDLVKSGAKIEIAEQVHLRPLHAARIAVAHSGILGTPHSASVCVSHGYHGISVMRRALGVTFEPVTVRAIGQKAKALASGGRDRHSDGSVQTYDRTLGWFQFEDGRLGEFDFPGEFYFSNIRGSRVLIRGELGELDDVNVRTQADATTPVARSLRREGGGTGQSFDPAGLRAILLGDQVVYRNPLYPAPLNDDEIAIGTMMLKMGEYVDGGPSFYSLAEGMQDRYLDILLERAKVTGDAVRSEPMPWH